MFDILMYTSPYTDIALLFARVVPAIVFLYFGIPKLRDLRGNAEDFTAMGFTPGWFWGTPIALLEVFGGAALIIGLWVPAVALLFAGHMTVGTIWKITKTDKGFGDWSYDVLLLALMVLLLAFGAGSLTLL